MKTILIILFILIIFDRDDSPRRGGGYQPRPLPRGLNRIRPPGAALDSPHIRYRIGGSRWPWDIRPRWLWEEMWYERDLPYGVEWADKMRVEIREMNSGYIREGMVRKGGINPFPSQIIERPPPPAPMRPKKP